MKETIRKYLINLPDQPGIYRFFDTAGRLLYIGKAVNLKRRVSSYFQTTTRQPRLADLAARITRIEYTSTGSVIEALILEANEINTHQPPYNVRLKDNKTFAVIVVTDEDFPRVIVARPTQKLKIAFKHQFGPYTSADQARTALKIIRKILPFRTNCHIPKITLDHLHLTSVNREVSRGCLDFQLGLCPGSCVGAVTKKEYSNLLRRVILFLQGKKQSVNRDLNRAMTLAAKKRNFERAATLRNQLFALDHIRDVALIKSESRLVNHEPKEFRRIEAYDISNLGQNYAVGSMIVLLNKQPDKAEYRKFQIKTVVGQNDIAMMEEVLTRRFRHLEWPMPDLIVVDGGEEHLRMAKRIIKKLHLTIPLIAVAKGPKRRRLDLYEPPSQHLTINNRHLTDLVRLARDEAHRFAITYHRTRRDQQFLVE